MPDVFCVGNPFQVHGDRIPMAAYRASTACRLRLLPWPRHRTQYFAPRHPARQPRSGAFHHNGDIDGWRMRQPACPHQSQPCLTTGRCRLQPQGNRAKEFFSREGSLMVRSEALAQRLEPLGNLRHRENLPPHPSSRPEEGLLRVRAEGFRLHPIALPATQTTLPAASDFAYAGRSLSLNP